RPPTAEPTPAQPAPPVRTAVRTERLAVAVPAAAPSATGAALAALLGKDFPPRLLAVAAGVALAAAIGGGLIARGCRGGRAGSDVERRMARIEDLLGMADGGAGESVAMPAVDAGVIVSLDDRSGACAIAKIASYTAWQEALAKAKTRAQPAEAACADVWNDQRKQACYHAAMAEIRATQAARDTSIGGGAAARDAAAAVRDDPRNEAIAKAKAASAAASSACDDDAGP
ncbi:MAG: hypothetical protein ACRELB_18970, partial [Polyangiaceae bacterium]